MNTETEIRELQSAIATAVGKIQAVNKIITIWVGRPVLRSFLCHYQRCGISPFRSTYKEEDFFCNPELTFMGMPMLLSSKLPEHKIILCEAVVDNDGIPTYKRCATIENKPRPVWIIKLEEGGVIG